jgi:cleavage and polyadenylation specificity factor subunit 3
MQSRFKEKDEDVKIHTPRNLETLNLSFRGERVAKVRNFFFLDLKSEYGS